jgi:hypothetical protein
LVIGLLGATASYGALAVKGLVVDSDVAADAASRAMGDARVRDLLVDETADAVRDQLIGAEGLRTLESLGIDPNPDTRAMAEAVVAAPEFRTAFVATVRDLHHVVFVERGPAPVIDATPVIAVARLTAIQRNPAYAEVLAPTGTLRVTVPMDDLPDLTGLGDGLDGRAMPLGLGALGVAAAGIAISSTRARALRRAGGWCAGVGLLQAAVAFLLPIGAGSIGGDGGPIAEAIARTLLPRLLVPAAMISAGGVGLIIAGWRWQRSYDRRHERAGAAAFLEAEELLLPSFFDGTIETATLRSPMGAPPVRRAGSDDDRSPLPPGAIFDVPARDTSAAAKRGERGAARPSRRRKLDVH